ncbi:hypothetical protein [Bordetella avium]|uniref:Uncharacterized protein n=1 Tax=Bordetella avium (strain 197N) TaxID=360910 RepID=Q2L0Y4_BORA1|nr:hypothetical protein [Bordetella avium]WQE32103.1 hypothetical protein U0029_09135 [Bordetella avium]CAJ49393.1 conserved hypothetical protein [Bordetella avium 197N]SUV68953.1 Uncharacterised protein [Bordetella avium]
MQEPNTQGGPRREYTDAAHPPLLANEQTYFNTAKNLGDGHD